MTDVPEFSRPFPLDRLGAHGFEETVTATLAECAALELRLGIPAVRSLACRWRLRRGAAGRVDAEGRLTARLVRECVVTLDTFTAESAEDFKVVFAPAGSEIEDPDPEAVDELPYEGVAIDLGEAAVEQLALTMDPYPHKAGAALTSFEESPGLPSPFAILAKLTKG